jgi:bifunctional non-homologous end joining protein LigD
MLRRPSDPLPDFIDPELATLVERAPEGNAWLHEIKLDGYRTAARIEGRQIRLLTRTGLDWKARFRPIATALGELTATTAYVNR